MLRFCLFGVFLLFLVPSPVTADFYPNSSAIPPELRSKTTGNSFLNLTGCHAGMKVDGLQKLKKYFQHFGYIPQTLSGNFTNDFDDTLKNAVEMYQSNFQLNVTGELDDLTLKQVMTPRCGVADVVNGHSSMRTGRRAYEVKFAGRGPRFHTVKHYSFFPGQPRWQIRHLTYAFEPRNNLKEEVKGLFSRAFARWAEITPLTFTRVETFSSSNITIGFYARDHGDNYPFSEGTLGHAFPPPNGRCHFDGNRNWTVSGEVGTESIMTNAFDLESVAVHEIGHLLGLGHSSVPDSVMYPTIPAGTRKVDLASDDVAGVRQLYGANPKVNG